MASQKTSLDSDKRIVRLTLTILLVSFPAFALGPCRGSGNAKPTVLEIPLELGRSESDALLSGMIPGPDDVVEARWDPSGLLSCVGLLTGRNTDLRQIASQLENAPNASGQRVAYAVVTMPRKRRVEEPFLTAIQSPARACIGADDALEATKRGLLHLRAQGSRTQLAADCFRRAAISLPDSLPANFGAAIAFALLGDYKTSSEYYERVSAIEPLMSGDSRLAAAKSSLSAGDWKPFIQRLDTLAQEPLALATKELLYRAMKAGAEDSSDPFVSATAQQGLVSTLARIREIAPIVVGDQSWWFENLDLGSRLESFEKWDEAMTAYESAFRSAASDRSRFEPDLGRIRIARRKQVSDGEIGRRCDAWRKQVSSPFFKIDDRSSGGLDMALARIDYSCGNNSGAAERIKRWLSKRPSWDAPYRVLGEMLQAQVRPQEGARAFGFARQVKQARDREALRRVVSEAEAMLKARSPE